MFKLGDYVIDDCGLVLHLTNEFHVEVINKHGGYRYATQSEIEEYHWEEFE